MKKAREVFDELLENENRFSHAEIEDIWDIFIDANGEDIEASMILYFADASMYLDDKSFVEMTNKIFDVSKDSCHLFLTVEDYCKWVIGECYKLKKGFTPYNLQEIIMNIHDNFDDDDYNDIFDEGTFILQQNENDDYDPCNIVPADRADVESLLTDYLAMNGEDAMSIVLEYCDDDLMKLWYDCWDIIVPIYDKWQEKLERMEEEEED